MERLVNLVVTDHVITRMWERVTKESYYDTKNFVLSEVKKGELSYTAPSNYEVKEGSVVTYVKNNGLTYVVDTTDSNRSVVVTVYIGGEMGIA